jgi:hypothetical protein
MLIFGQKTKSLFFEEQMFPNIHNSNMKFNGLSTDDNEAKIWIGNQGRNQDVNLAKLRLNRTWHMGFLTGQDRTPKFAGQVLPDRTESRTNIFNILPNMYGLSILIW